MPALDKAKYLFRALDMSDDLRSGEEWVLRSGVQINNGEVLCFLDQMNQIGLIIPAAQDEFDRFSDDRKSKAIHLTRRKTQTSVSTTEFQARLTLKDINQSSIFYFFVDEILSYLDSNPAASISDVEVFLARWRRFFSSDNKSVIDPQVELGLLCELEVLRQLFEDNVPNPIEQWFGPQGDRHDFVLPDYAIECKASASLERMTISIHGSHQLETLNGKPLFLVYRRYQQHPEGTISIPSLIDELQTFSAFNVEAFLEKISPLGLDLFSSDSAGLFHRYFAVDCYEFEVVEEFPRVSTANADGRIHNLQYNIDLAGPTSVPGFQAFPRFIR